MKETSTDGQVGREGQVGGLQRARVEALDHGHARVLAQAPVELAVGDVDRGDALGAALQQAVGEAAGRGADVEAVAPGDVDAERLERVLELDAAARDVARALVDDQRRVAARPAGSAAAPPARPRRPAPRPPAPRPAAAERDGNSPCSRQNRVYPGLLHRRNGTASRRIASFIRAVSARCNSLLTGQAGLWTHGLI